MNETAQAFAAADRPLTQLLDGVPLDRWARPSPCPDWSARDVVAHLVGAQREFLGGRGVDLGPAPDVPADPAGAWRDHAGRVAAGLADDAVVQTPFDGHFGPTTLGRSFVDFYVFDMVVHRWDVARAVGGDESLTDAELDRIETAADSWGDALYLDGVCRRGVVAPAGADRQRTVLARLGRGA